jgi:hypothetical protein
LTLSNQTQHAGVDFLTLVQVLQSQTLYVNVFKSRHCPKSVFDVKNYYPFNWVMLLGWTGNFWHTEIADTTG